MSAPHVVRPATTDDLPTLVQLMTEFYQDAASPMRPEDAKRAFSELLREPGYGSVWLIEVARQTAGYVVLTLGFSMEYGGRDAFIDDLYLRPQFRGSGVGKAALATVRAKAIAKGVRALHLEVDRDNVVAQRLYAGFGFENNDRELHTLWLADPD